MQHEKSIHGHDSFFRYIYDWEKLPEIKPMILGLGVKSQ